MYKYIKVYKNLYMNIYKYMYICINIQDCLRKLEYCDKVLYFL